MKWKKSKDRSLRYQDSVEGQVPPDGTGFQWAIHDAAA
jgi:hypothetical protein